MKIELTENAKFIIDRLQSCGYECYAVGGCVRDSLRGITPHDWDFTTSALPDEIESAFSDCKTADIGKRYGTIAVILDGKPYEITTYRVDGGYSDSRHPDEVSFSGRLSDDLARRDFTVNAMAYNDRYGLVDLYCGRSDLGFGVIRCVGEPEQRFCEDALRILRALRFAATLGFSIEQKTAEAILKLRAQLNGIAAERIRDELLRLLCGEKTFLKPGVLFPELGVLGLESLHPLLFFDSHITRFFLYASYKKTGTLSQTVDEKGVCHYKNHPKIGAAMTAEILRRLCLPNDFIDDVCELIRFHDERFRPDAVLLKKYLKLLGEEKMKMLYKIQRADILAQSSYMREEKLRNLGAVYAELERIIESGECYCLRMLAVNGADLLHLGYRSGAVIGEMLDTLLNKVITGELPNEKEALLSFAQGGIDKA